MPNAALIRRAVTEFRTDITPLSEDLSVSELATVLEQLTFSRDGGFIRLVTLDRGVRDFLVRALRRR